MAPDSPSNATVLSRTGRLEDFLGSMPDAVLVVDSSGVIEYANPETTNTFGYAVGDLVGQAVEVLVPDGARPTHEGLRAAYVDDASVRPMGRDLPIRGRRADGSTFAADIKLSPIDLDGEMKVVAVVRDVTERREAARKLEHLGLTLSRANEQLRARNEELEQFAFVASHDLQEPLRKIVAFGDRLGARYGDVLPEQGQDYIDRMRAAALRMQNLIDDLLAWSRLTTQAKPFAPVDLQEICDHVLSDLELAIRKAEATVSVAELPTVDGDPTQLRQLMQNLVANSIKYRRDEVPPMVRIEATVDENVVTIAVHDNGIGFEPQYAHRIFTIFERLHSRAAYQGTGVGLAICRKIVRRHHGEIEAEGRPGDGATFKVHLPLRQEPRDDEADHDSVR